jgi:hypothetical protein
MPTTPHALEAGTLADEHRPVPLYSRFAHCLGCWGPAPLVKQQQLTNLSCIRKLVLWLSCLHSTVIVSAMTQLQRHCTVTVKGEVSVTERSLELNRGGPTRVFPSSACNPCSR